MVHELEMTIESQDKNGFVILVVEGTEQTRIIFNPTTKSLTFMDHNSLADFLKRNEDQLRRLLHNKRKDSFYRGFYLNFVLIDQRDIAAYSIETISSPWTMAK